jgi:tetratricopeptide (TPR) repeat protein
LSSRGDVYRKKGDLDRAITDYNDAISIDPKDVYAYSGRGFAYSSKGDLDRAIADANTTIELQPDNADNWNSRCWRRALANRDIESALLDCDRALRLEKDGDHFLDSRGLVYFRLGRFDESIADNTAALKINPKRPHSLYIRGLAKLKKGDKSDGDKDIAEAKVLDAKIAEFYEKYGVRP